MEEGHGVPEHGGAPVGTDRSEVADTVAVDVRCHLRLEVALVMDDPCDHQRETDAAGDLDRFGGPLVGMDATEEEEVTPATLAQSERAGVDAVVDGGDIVEARMPVRLADGDVGSMVVVLLVD